MRSAFAVIFTLTCVGTGLTALSGCGVGADPLSHTGVCGNYPTYSSSAYVLPYAVGTTHEVSQGNCSGVSHYGDYRYAYDFTMPIGTSVVAARAGLVIEIEESFEDGNGCPDANFIRIEHTDGTVGEYAHLTKDGVLVAKGDPVVQGQAIGLSGNTGCSTGAHLHFQVLQSEDSSETRPISFQNTKRHRRGLKAGTSYTAE